MADIRVFEQVDKDLGEIGINMDHVVKVERQEERGMRRDSPIENLSAVFVTTNGDRIQVPITAAYYDGELDWSLRKVHPGPTITGSR